MNVNSILDSQHWRHVADFWLRRIQRRFPADNQPSGRRIRRGPGRFQQFCSLQFRRDISRPSRPLSALVRPSLELRKSGQRRPSRNSNQFVQKMERIIIDYILIYGSILVGNKKVAVCAGCGSLAPWAAFVTGSLGGLAFVCGRSIADKLKGII